MFVFPMVGLSRRFAQAGYERPKYELEAHGRPLFDFAVGGFAALFGSEDFLFVVRGEDAGRFAYARCAALGMDPSRLAIVTLDAPTSGQAETVAMGLDRAAAAPGDPLTIFNIDTMRPGFRYPGVATAQGTDGYLEVFRGPGDHWSFVEPTEDGARVARVTEKDRISDLCSTGLYHFARTSDFQDAYAEVADVPPETLQGGERYVAPLYNRLIARGARIGYHVIGAEEVHFFGTPSEYDAFKARPDGDTLRARIEGP